VISNSHLWYRVRDKFFFVSTSISLKAFNSDKHCWTGETRVCTLCNQQRWIIQEASKNRYKQVRITAIYIAHYVTSVCGWNGTKRNRSAIFKGAFKYLFDTRLGILSLFRFPDEMVAVAYRSANECCSPGWYASTCVYDSCLYTFCVDREKNIPARSDSWNLPCFRSLPP
jgi:hypothetical protein